MPDSGVYAAVRSRTKAACGIGIPPHRFRDIAVASMGETDPQLVWLALPLLQHRDRRIAEKHYNQARDASAVGVWQDYVIAKRRTSKAKNQRSSQDS